MGLSRALGCFRDSDASTSKRRKKQINPQSKQERANRIVPDSILKDKNNPTPTIGTRSYLLPPAPDSRGTKPPHTGNRIQETKRGPSDTTNKTAPGNSPRGTDSSQVPVERTVLGDDYEPEPWSMGAVRRRTSMLSERKSPVVTSTEEKIPNGECQSYQQSAFSQDVYAYWMSKGSPVRAIDLLGLPPVDVKQLRAKGSGVAQGDEAEGVIVEEYTGPIRPAWSRPKS
jgi:hypothetical protein